MPSNNVPVNGWPQLKLLDKVQPILNELDKIERWQKSVKLVTRSGNVVTVPNALALDAQRLKVTFAPIQSGSGDPSPTNVRPISGHTKTSAVVSGKNLFEATADTTTFRGVTFTKNNDGTYTASNSCTQSGDYATLTVGSLRGIKEGRAYKVCGCPANGALDTYHLNIVCRNSGGTSLASVQDMGEGATITVPSGGDRIDLVIRCYYNVDVSGKVFKPMINFSSVSDIDYAHYEQFKGKDTHTTPFGDTYYSGYVDVVSGELVVTHANAEFDGSSDEGWTNAGSQTGSQFKTAVTLNNKAGTLLIANSYKGIVISSWGDLHNGEIAFHPTSANNMQLIDERYNTVAGFEAYLASNPLQVVYELATPIRIALTPEQVTMFNGYITTYADIGPIEIVLYTGDSWS